MSIKQIFTDCMTESDGITHDVYRWLAVFSLAVGCGLAIYGVISGKPFDIQNYGVGMGALFGGIGVALGLKKEPPQPREPS